MSATIRVDLGNPGQTLAGTISLPGDDILEFVNGDFTIASSISGPGTLLLRRVNNASTRETVVLSNQATQNFAGTLQVGESNLTFPNRSNITVDFNYVQTDPTFALSMQAADTTFAQLNLDDNLSVSSALFEFTDSPSIVLPEGVYSFTDLEDAGVGDFIVDGGASLYVGVSIPETYTILLVLGVAAASFVKLSRRRQQLSKRA